MSSKKINYNMASNIATAIAEKAFEHLTAPLRIALDRIGEEALLVIEQRLDISALRDFGLAEPETVKMAIDIALSSDGSRDNMIRTYTKHGFSMYAWKAAYIVDDALYQRAEAIHTPLREFVRKQNTLRDEIRAQLEGKTVTVACKAWPEAAEIICDVAGVANGPAFTVPLESLLSKYLPMLAAPQGV